MSFPDSEYQWKGQAIYSQPLICQHIREKCLQKRSPEVHLLPPSPAASVPLLRVTAS